MNERKAIVSEIGRFGLVGIMSVIIDAVVYFMCINMDFLSPENAKRTGFVSGAIFGFFMNRDFTFRVETKNLKQPIRFAGLYMTSFLANSLSHDLIFLQFQVPFLSFIIATAVSTIINYVGQRYYVFR